MLAKAPPAVRQLAYKVTTHTGTRRHSFADDLTARAYGEAHDNVKKIQRLTSRSNDASFSDYRLGAVVFRRTRDV